MRALLALLLLAGPLLGQAVNGWAPIENSWSEIQTPAATGTVTTTGSPASGQVALVSGATSITGDAGHTYSGTGTGFKLGIGTDVFLSRASAGTLLVEDGSGNARDLQARTGTFGTSVVTPVVDAGGTTYLTLTSRDGGGGSVNLSGKIFLPTLANVQDLGTSSTPWRLGYFGTSVVTPTVQGATTTTTLTESAATSFATLTYAASTVAGAEFLCRIQANDATDFQVLTSRVRVSTVRKATGNTVSAVNVVGTDLLAESAGGSTLTCTFTVAEGASAATVQANCVSSLTQTTLNISFLAEAVGPVVIAQL